MKITTEIPDNVVETVVQSIMENFPEASQGSVLHCLGWKYKEMNFMFFDEETEKDYILDKTKLLATFPLLFTDKWPNGCTPAPLTADMDKWNDWLCQCDATDFDAFVQLACLGEVIYG